MKLKEGLLSCAVALTMLAVACNDARGPMETRSYHWADSTAHSFLIVDAELPSGSGKAAAQVRSELAGVVDELLSRITSYENERYFPAFEGSRDDMDALMGYYCDSAFAAIARMSKADADEREKYIMEDTDLSDEEKEEILADFPRWEYEFGLKKIDDTDRYVVFQSMDYIYMGGAHGGVTGLGCLTFSKKDGSRVEDFVDASRLQEMQPVLIKGLLEYYSDMGYDTTWDELKESLFIDDGVLPLPTWPLYPSEDGLNFVYQQYEIASYAEGMPSFTVPYADIEPFLTPEARALLGL